MERSLSDADLEQIAARGITVEEVERQLRLHAQPPPRIVLDRPCTLGDGIESIAPEAREECARRAEQAAAAGRVSVFVPASGAATRMFEMLLAWPTREALPGSEELRRRAEEGDRNAAGLLRLVRELRDFAFYDELRELLERRGLAVSEIVVRERYGTLLGALLEPEGLGLAELPKALVPFHRGPDRVRTAIEEQIAEASQYARDATGRTRLHFTVPAEFLERCRAVAARSAQRAAITFSCQEPRTDTIAATRDARPFRQADGTLLFRPGGHGALISNLATCGADLVVVKNIDNVRPESNRATVVQWKKILIGRLLEVRGEVDHHLDMLERRSPEAAARAGAFLENVLGISTAGMNREALVERLDRPLRTCGVVRNTGEPGGGPFWVRSRGTVSRQIVESAQVDRDDPGQEKIFAASTHFNPVDIVAALRDRRGHPYDLERYVDPEAVFFADKSHGGEPLRALERPGLWNGAMAGWNTVFVDVPAETFAPVKTLFDLLRPEHRGG